MSPAKKRKKVILEVLGFPIELRDVPLRKALGEWMLDIDYNKLQEAVALTLAADPARLTGNHIKFLRKYLDMTRVKFAEFLGVTQPCVTKWEQFGNKATNMSRSTEKDIKLKVLSESKIRPKEFALSYKALSGARPKAPRPGLRMSIDQVRDRKKLLAERLESVELTGS